MLLLEGLAGIHKWGSAWSSHFHGGKTKALWKIKGHSYSWEENQDLLNQLTAYWIALVCDYSSCMESNVHQWWQRLGIYPVITWLFSRLYWGVVAFSPLHDKSHRSNTGFWNLEFCCIKGKTVKKKVVILAFLFPLSPVILLQIVGICLAVSKLHSHVNWLLQPGFADVTELGATAIIH